MKNAYQKYKATSVQSASREKILLMLYEACIRFVKQAIKACEEKNIHDKCYNIGRAYDIIMELNNTLDHKIGGDISKNLEQLYMYIMERFTKANISSDTEELKIALKIIEDLYQAWVGAVEKIKKEQESNKK